MADNEKTTKASESPKTAPTKSAGARRLRRHVLKKLLQGLSRKQLLLRLKRLPRPLRAVQKNRQRRVLQSRRLLKIIVHKKS